MTTRYSKMKRLVTERDAKRIRKHGKVKNAGYIARFGKSFKVYKYKNATYTEWY